MRTAAIVCLALVAGAAGAGEVRKQWVFFADKGCEQEVRAQLEELERTYNTRAVQRRQLRRSAEGLFDERDAPVPARYLEAMGATGARIDTVSRWLNAASAHMTEEQAAEIRLKPFVAAVEPVRVRRSAPPPPVREEGGAGPAAFYGLAQAQVTQLRLHELHALGLTGRGMVIGVLDTGFKRTHAAFNHPEHTVRVLAEYDFVMGDGNTAPEPGDPVNQHEHGTYILGTLAAYLPEQLVGAAYEAEFILAKVEDVVSEYPAEEDWYVAGLEFIEANGGDIATSSLTAYWYTFDQMDGVTSVMARGINTATENGLICFQGAGNFGHDADPTTNHLVTPGDAFEVITVGAVQANGAIASFSSDGPTTDGRLKPEVLARGQSTWTVSPTNDTGFVAPSGTSMSTPLAAGAGACILQAHPGLTVRSMRRVLFATATDFVANGVPDPLSIRGYGIIDALGALRGACPADFNGDGQADFFDYLDFVGAYASEHPSADFNGDGQIDFFDYLDFVEAYSEGC